MAMTGREMSWGGICRDWGRAAIALAVVGIGGSLLLARLGGCQTVPFGYQAVPRDAFPVFDDPPMTTAQEAERLGIVRERDAVIGIAAGGEAKAYPISVMGVHELGNDTIAGIPIAVSW